MKRIIYILSFLVLHAAVFSQFRIDKDASKTISEASEIAYKENSKMPSYIRLQKGKEIDTAEWKAWLVNSLRLSKDIGFAFQNTQTDQKGDVHNHYTQTYKNIPILGKTYITHSSKNKIYMVNGDITSFLLPSSIPLINEKEALSFALKKINASLYKWQIHRDENILKETLGNPAATFFPKGELYYVPEGGNFDSQHFILAYRFDIYSIKPLARKYVFVDATTGKIIMELNRIMEINKPGTAYTKYSGTQTITTDSIYGHYRLRETGRGNGIETYNMKKGFDYSLAVDFTDADNIWNNVNAQMDEVATDAHWGAEKTYDFYKNKFGRNGIDGNGFHLVSFVHYYVNYVNAFWDGIEMTYGDGNSTYSPLTTLDICGHEITHGLTEYTADLIYQDEPAALNEGYSDIFGTCIEWYARPSNADWLMGADCGPAFRNIADPNSYSQPDTYKGLYWDANQEPHQNSTVLSHWFYLATQGGSGNNDNSDYYNITGIGMDSAAAVAYRTLTLYLTPTATYADARLYSIISALDLYGPCAPQVETVTNAWYAVGVGPPYSPAVIADFTADKLSFCSHPATVHFTNLSNNAIPLLWDFGDGGTSTQVNPSHTYNTVGTFTVTLIADGSVCGRDTLSKTAYITVDTTLNCVINMPRKGAGDVQSSCTGRLRDSGGDTNYQDRTHSNITIAPIGATNVKLIFSSFSFELNYDYLTIYDGPDTTSPLIGAYTGSNLPNGGVILSSTGAITLVQFSDQFVNYSGFDLIWQCLRKPVANFTANDTVSCTGIVHFNDLSANHPTTWLWNFGDGDTSSLQSPVHTYTSDGTYTVTLSVANAEGSAMKTKSDYIIIRSNSTAATALQAPVLQVCKGTWVPLSVTGGSLGTGANWQWYSDSCGGSSIISGPNVALQVTTTTTYYVRAEGVCNTTACVSATVTTDSSNTVLSLKVLPEGLFINKDSLRHTMDYDTISGFAPKWGASVADTFTIALHDNSNYNNIVFKAVGVQLKTNGTTKIYVPCSVNGNYYIEVRFKNHLTTGSATTPVFSGCPVVYDFSDNTNKAFGNNMKNINGAAVVYAGDLSSTGFTYPGPAVKDGVIDISDVYYVFGSYLNGDYGYLLTDLSGDGVTDLKDVYLVFDNYLLGVFAVKP